jgi:hypothetical protein
MILEHVARRLAEYDRQSPRRYNVAADSVYSARRESGYGADGHVEAMVAGLEAFGMSRVMGTKADRRSKWTKRFQQRVEIVTDVLRGLTEASLVTVNLETHRETISDCYELLSGASKVDSSIWRKGDRIVKSPVGATKVLHWLVPELFIMVDANVRRAFKHYYPEISGKDSAGTYFEQMQAAQREIRELGDELPPLCEDMPLARVFDKVAFMVGKGIGEQ